MEGIPLSVQPTKRGRPERDIRFPLTEAPSKESGPRRFRKRFLPHDTYDRIQKGELRFPEETPLRFERYTKIKKSLCESR